MKEDEHKQLLREIMTAVLTVQIAKVIPSKEEILEVIIEGTKQAISDCLPESKK